MTNTIQTEGTFETSNDVSNVPQPKIDPNNLTVEQKAYEFDRWLYNNRAMAQIIQAMREHAVLPESEQIKEKEINPLVKVDFPDEGGILSYLEGYEIPFLGFPFHEFVEVIDTMKKVGKGLLSGFYHFVWKNGKIKFIALPVSFWLIKRLLRILVYAFYRQVTREKFKIKPTRYCKAIRELHRAFSVDVDRERLKRKELRYMIRDLFCMVLEFDNAYRFRFQDLAVEIDKKALKKNYIKELQRIISIAEIRENTQEIKDMWILVKMLVRMLQFDKNLKSIVVDMLHAINLEKIALNENDIQFCKPRTDYTFAFMQKLKQ